MIHIEDFLQKPWHNILIVTTWTETSREERIRVADPFPGRDKLQA